MLIRLYLAIEVPIRRTNSIMIDIAIAVIVLFICLQLFFRPQLLYGIFSPVSIRSTSENGDQNRNFDNGYYEQVFNINKQLVHNEEQITAADVLNDVQNLRYKKIIDRLFLEKSPFLDSDYSLEAMVKEIGISRSTASAFINRQYGMGFREFLNRQRVDYFKNNLNKPEWENLTLEAIAGQCGFSNRNTFIKNFKEITGETPTEYLKRKKRESNSI